MRSQDEEMAASPPDWREDDRVCWMIEGTAVWYQSSPHHRHKGVIASTPRPFRDGWTVGLADLDPSVPPGKTTSSAAWCDNVEPRVTDHDMFRMMRVITKSLVDHIVTCGGDTRRKAQQWRIFHTARMVCGLTAENATMGPFRSDLAALGMEWVADEAGVTLETAPRGYHD